MIELNITIKDSERKLTKKFLQYDTMPLDRDNDQLRFMVEEVIKEFKSNAEADSPDIVVKAKMIW